MRDLRLVLTAPVAASVLTLLGCGKISGIDEYSVGPPGGGPLENPCGPLEVVTEDGQCVETGVAACSEREGFQPDGEGGCLAIMRGTDCPKGQRAPLGSRTCEPAGATCSASGAPIPDVPDAARTRYVDKNALPGGDGRDQAHALPTLKEGLAALPSGGYLLVKAGEYRENLVVTQSNLAIMGCAGATLLAGETADSGPDDPCRLEYPYGRVASKRATVCIAPGTAGVRLNGLGVTGPGDGVAVVGSTDAALDLVSIQETGNIGLRIEQAPHGGRAAASATLRRSIVDQATGVGIYVAGARVEITDSTVRNTRLRHEAESVGVSIHPAGFIGRFDDPSAVTRADVTIGESVITGHLEAAVRAAGGRVTIENSLLGNLDALPESGRGLVAQAAMPFGVGTEVTVSGSVIQRTRDAAVDALCASVTLERTTVLDTLHGFEPSLPETPSVETCSGQGVRVRSLPLELCDPKSGVETHLVSSTVTRSRQAAVLNVASKVTLEQALLTDSTVDAVTEPCGRTLGNGLVLESLPENQAEAVVKSSLITKNPGAGILSGWGTLALTSNRLCDNARNVVVAGDGSASGARCGCGARLPECPVERALFDSWLATGAASAFPDRSAVWEPVPGIKAFPSAGQAPLANFAVWDLDHPEVPAVLSDASGQFRLAYLAGLSRPAMWRPEWMPVAQHAQTSRGWLFNITTSKMGAVESLDWNLAMVWASSIPQGACVTSTRGPLGILSSNFIGIEPGVRCVNQAGTAALPNLDPGWITVRLDSDSLPAGVTCRPEAAPAGFPVDGDPNALRVKLERGMIMNVIFACTSATR